MGNTPSNASPGSLQPRQGPTYQRRYVTPEIVISQSSGAGAQVGVLPTSVRSTSGRGAVPIENATCLKTDFYIKHESVVVYENISRPWLVAVDFACDCRVRTSVSLHAVALDVQSAGSDFQARIVPKYPKPPVSVSLTGPCQCFLPPALQSQGEDSCAIDTRLYQLGELTHVPMRDMLGVGGPGGSTGVPATLPEEIADRVRYVGAVIPDSARLPVPASLYPVVVTLGAEDSTKEQGSANPVVAVFLGLKLKEHCDSDQSVPHNCPPGWRPSRAFTIRILRTAVQYAGCVYDIKSMYGMAGGSGEKGEGVGVDTGQRGGDMGQDIMAKAAECVVCLTEPSTHAALPCGHVCLCGTCATQLRTRTNKCPVCRAPVLELLKLQQDATSA